MNKMKNQDPSSKIPAIKKIPHVWTLWMTNPYGKPDETTFEGQDFIKIKDDTSFEIKFHEESHLVMEREI